jgi:uncharacterized protein YegL
MNEDYSQQPFGNVEFADNPENRCACILLLDTSASMSGERIRQLNEGLRLFEQELKSDDLAAKRVEVAIVTFGPVSVITEFTSAMHFVAPVLTANGNTPMGAAIERGLDLLRERKDQYVAAGIPYYKPWAFLITDGSPTDSWANAAQRVKAESEKKSLSFFGVAVEGADLATLEKISSRAPIKLQGLSFKELFSWLSNSLSSVSKSKPGDEVALTVPKGWATV